MFCLAYELKRENKSINNENFFNLCIFDDSMMRRITAISFLYLANIILLVHTLVPHHHHKEQVCIQDSHCQTENPATKHNDSEKDHRHDGKTTTEYCILKQLIVVPSSPQRQDGKYFGCYLNYPAFDGFQAILLYTDLEPFVPLLVFNEPAPSLTSGYTRFLSTALGLRAPPIV